MAAAVVTVYLRHSQAQAVVVVVGKLRDSELVAAAAAAVVRGMQPTQTATRLLHLQVKATMAEQVVAMQAATKAAVVVVLMLSAQILLIRFPLVLVAMALRHRLRLVVSLMLEVAVAVVITPRKAWAAVAAAVMAAKRKLHSTQLQVIQTKAAAVVAVVGSMAPMCQQTAAAVW